MATLFLNTYSFAENAGVSNSLARPPYTDRVTRKNKKLFRSTGSFSSFEDSIVAPKPQRKIALISQSTPSTPAPQRRDKSSRRSFKPEESLFGEAGHELQTILMFSSAPTTPTPNYQEQENFHEELMRELDLLRSESSCLSPPTRALNPVPMNSPFQGQVAEAVKDVALVSPAPKVKPKSSRPLLVKKNLSKDKQTVSKATRKSCEIQGRARSKSWPALPIVA